MRGTICCVWRNTAQFVPPMILSFDCVVPMSFCKSLFFFQRRQTYCSLTQIGQFPSGLPIQPTISLVETDQATLYLRVREQFSTRIDYDSWEVPGLRWKQRFVLPWERLNIKLIIYRESRERRSPILSNHGEGRRKGKTWIRRFFVLFGTF